MIVRGSTPTHKFVLPFSPLDISDAIITYQQNGVTVINKKLKDVYIDMESNAVCVQLTQRETLSFFCGEKYSDNIVNIQVRVIDNNGNVYASNIIREKAVNILWDEIIDTIPKDEDIVYYDGGNVRQGVLLCQKD